MPTALPDSASRAPRRRALAIGLVLGVMLAAPVVGYWALQVWLISACDTRTIASGEVDGPIAWRISRMECGNGAAPFYDVQIGARDKTLTTALTARGAPAPVSVERLDGSRLGVRFESPPPGVAHPTPIRLRRSGSPAERVDLEAAAARRGPPRVGGG